MVETYGVEDKMLSVLSDLAEDDSYTTTRLAAGDTNPGNVGWLVSFADEGSATGVFVPLSDTAERQLVTLAGQIQDIVVEHNGFLGLDTAIPPCPSHPGTHPLAPAVNGAHAVWMCPADKSISRPII